jgi:hypothetical protein
VFQTANMFIVMRDKQIERMRRIGETRAAVRRHREVHDIPVVPTTPAAPRNSLWQEAILETLADGDFAPTSVIIARLGFTAPTAAQRVTVSRALARLRAKALIEARDPVMMLRRGRRLWRLVPNG